jgi:hypothetical protein
MMEIYQHVKPNLLSTIPGGTTSFPIQCGCHDQHIRLYTSLIGEEAQREKLAVVAVSLVPYLSVIIRAYGLERNL